MAVFTGIAALPVTLTESFPGTVADVFVFEEHPDMIRMNARITVIEIKFFIVGYLEIV